MTANDWEGEIEAILSRVLGFEASSIGSASFHASVRSAYLDSGFDDPFAFGSAVRDDPRRQQALIARVVVPETWFLRDEAPFAFLQQHAAQWARRHPTGVLRVLSAPCASGEEAYSIAMSLLEAGLPPARFAVEAVDVSEPLLTCARRGVYQGPAFRKCPPALQLRYFSPCDGGLQLNAAVRASVMFELCNLAGTNVRLPSARYDVVFCRNLLIYLHRAARQALMRVLSDALAPDGLLIVGHAEVLPMCESGVFGVADSRAFALVRTPQAAAATPRPASRTSAPAPAAQPPRRLSPRTASSAQASRPSPVVSSDDDVLEQARLLADRGQLDEARRLCEQLIDDRGPSDRIYFLLGVIGHAAGRHQEGAEALRKALYLNPMHREALLQLAVEHERRGDRSGAVRLRRRAERAPGAATDRPADVSREIE